MQYNVCGICGAKDGRAGMLIGNSTKGQVDACLNCHDTRTTGSITVHGNLIRTQEEIQKTFKIIEKNNII